MSWAALRALRVDVNPRGFGVLWDQNQRWLATTPDGRVIVAATPDALRRAIREVDGTTTADTRALPAVRDQGDEAPSNTRSGTHGRALVGHSPSVEEQQRLTQVRDEFEQAARFDDD